MKKKNIVVLICLLACTMLSLIGCKKEQASISPEKLEELCQISTVKICYHSYVKDEQSTLLGLIENNIIFEYDGTIELGVECKDVTIIGNTVTVTLSDAVIISARVDNTKTPTYVFYGKENVIKKNKTLDLNTQEAYFEKATAEMREEIEKNRQNYDIAIENAKALIKGFINQIGEINHVKYTVIYVIDK